MEERWVRYECPCCGEFQLKCYKTKPKTSKSIEKLVKKEKDYSWEYSTH